MRPQARSNSAETELSESYASGIGIASFYSSLASRTTSLDIPVKTLLKRTGSARPLSERDSVGAGLSSMLSHELRTPLTSIIGFAELLLKNPAMDDARRNEYLQYIHDEGLRLNDLVATIINEVLAAERTQSHG